MSRTAVVTFFAIIVALLSVHNLPWHLDDKDQAKQAYTSFEMIELGNWWFQHTPTGKVATKPPLAGWISATIYEAASGHGWEIAWRLPGFTAMLVMLAMLWRAGNRIHSPLGGLIAAGAFGLNHFSQRLATLVRTDALLAFCIFLAGFQVYEKVRKATPWTTRDRWWLFSVVLASMLTKGPIAYAFLMPGLLAFWWFSRRKGTVNFGWSGWWPWLTPLLIFGAWAAIGIARSPEFYQQVVVVEFLGRFTVGEAAVHHNQSVFFYIANLLGKFAPWAVLLAALHFRKSERAALGSDPARLWLVCWAIGGLIFMSLVPSKRADRIFPVIPPLCLLTAATLAPLAGERLWRWSGRQVATGAIGLAAIITGANAVFSVATHFRDDQRRLVRFGDEARAREGRLVVMNAKDEGLLLYTGTARFTEPDDAVQEWGDGKIDLLILNERDFTKRGPALAPFTIVSKVSKGSDNFSGYVLIAPGGR